MEGSQFVAFVLTGICALLLFAHEDEDGSEFSPFLAYLSGNFTVTFGALMSLVGYEYKLLSFKRRKPFNLLIKKFQKKQKYYFELSSSFGFFSFYFCSFPIFPNLSIGIGLGNCIPPLPTPPPPPPNLPTPSPPPSPES